jgi:hypothetical protein
MPAHSYKVLMKIPSALISTDKFPSKESLPQSPNPGISGNKFLMIIAGN